MPNLHIDRTISVYLCHPLARRRDEGSRPRIPILMYHSIQDENGGGHPYYETNTSPRVFAQHMNFLRENNYRVIGLEEAARILAGNGDSQKSVVITFDDGFADFYSQAFAILSEHGFTATVFVVTDLLKTQRTMFNGKQCLTLSETRELHAHGITIGSHTATHPELKLMQPDAVENELSNSKKTLEDALGAPVNSFSYPFAFPEANRKFVSMLADLLNKCHYQNGVCTILGTAKPGMSRWFLPRLPVNSWDDPRFFRAKLEGGYDWLHGPQYLIKTLQGFLS